MDLSYFYLEMVLVFNFILRFCFGIEILFSRYMIEIGKVEVKKVLVDNSVVVFYDDDGGLFVVRIGWVV